MNRRTEKPWGYEELISESPDRRVKLLFINEEHNLSLQLHTKKHETMFLVEGMVHLVIINSRINMRFCDSYVVRPLVVHRLEALRDSIILEISTGAGDEDIIRIEDDYGRVQKGEGV